MNTLYLVWAVLIIGMGVIAVMVISDYAYGGKSRRKFLYHEVTLINGTEQCRWCGVYHPPAHESCPARRFYLLGE